MVTYKIKKVYPFYFVDTVSSKNLFDFRDFLFLIPTQDRMTKTRENSNFSASVNYIEGTLVFSGCTHKFLDENVTLKLLGENSFFAWLVSLTTNF